MSMPQPVSRLETPSSETPQEPASLTPLYGPLPVAETTNGTVIPVGDLVSIDRDEASGRLYFCERDPGSGEVRVEAPVQGPAGGPWASSGIVQIGGQDYQLQVSLMFATSPKRQRLYGILVPVTLPQPAGRGQAEEPIVVWGSEDEGEGTTPDPLP